MLEHTMQSFLAYTWTVNVFALPFNKILALSYFYPTYVQYMDGLRK